MSSKSKLFQFKRFYYSTICYSCLTDSQPVNVSVENYKEFNLMIVNISNGITRIANSNSYFDNQKEVKLLISTLVELNEKFELMMDEVS